MNRGHRLQSDREHRLHMRLGICPGKMSHRWNRNNDLGMDSRGQAASVDTLREWILGVRLHLVTRFEESPTWVRYGEEYSNRVSRRVLSCDGSRRAKASRALVIRTQRPDGADLFSVRIAGHWKAFWRARGFRSWTRRWITAPATFGGAGSDGTLSRTLSPALQRLPINLGGSPRNCLP